MTQGPSEESPRDPSQGPAHDEQVEATSEGAAEAAPSSGPDQSTGRASSGEPAAESPAEETAAEETGASETGEAAEQPVQDELAVTRMELEERTLDLQRLQAEFVNYKRRVDRDRELIRENSTYQSLAPITDVLDNIDRAREHGPLDEGFRAVADQLERVVANQGLVRFGAPGDAFDPNLHDALSHMGEDPDVEVTTVKIVAKGGYRIGERVVRAAQVLVVDPPSGPTVPDEANPAAHSDPVPGSSPDPGAGAGQDVADPDGAAGERTGE